MLPDTLGISEEGLKKIKIHLDEYISYCKNNVPEADTQKVMNAVKGTNASVQVTALANVYSANLRDFMSKLSAFSEKLDETLIAYKKYDSSNTVITDQVSKAFKS